MKLFKITILSLFIAVFSACEAYLDKSPDLGLSEPDVFSNFYTVRGYLDQCYNNIMDFSKYDSQSNDRTHIGQLSDECANPQISNLTNIVNKGNWLSTTNCVEVGWGPNGVGSNKGLVIPNAFRALRVANKVIEKAPLMVNLTADEKTQLLGQAYFFRAWFYFEIIRRVGGMPIIDKAYSGADNMDLPRLSYAESNDWLVSQLDEAIKLLPDEWPAQELGRPNKAAAYALKSLAQLYAASPLMNNPIGVIENNGYNIERAKLAAQYSKECLDYIDNVVPQHKMMSGADYKNIFYHFPNFVSAESLWYINSTGTNRNALGELPIFWQNIRTSKRPGTYGQANVSISQNIIDKFQTINGYYTTLTSTGFVSNDPAFDPANPYQNRDPRFNAFIIYPGEPYGTYSDGTQNYNCTWEGGADVTVAPSAMVRTRYMVKKWQWPESLKLDRSVDDGYAKYYYNCVMIRTTTVWLNYAEAMNEAYGPTDKPAGYTYSALDAINMVRNRVGMVNVRPEFSSDATVFRNTIRDERAIELLLENNRWWDIRRWMIAEAVLNVPNPIKGVQVTASSATPLKPNAGNVFTYKLVDVTEEIRVFQKKHYWYPVGRDEANRLFNFKQNPGWE